VDPGLAAEDGRLVLIAPFRSAEKAYRLPNAIMNRESCSGRPALQQALADSRLS